MLFYILCIVFTLFLSYLSIQLIDKIRDKLLFMPDTSTESIILTDNVEELYIKTIDGVTLHAFYYKNNNSKDIIMFSHGNAGNILGRMHLLKYMSKLNNSCNVIMYDYRGYGKSTGSPCEHGLYTDAKTIYSYIIHDLNFLNENVILYGESLGTSVTLWLADHLINKQNIQPKCIILQSGFNSLDDVIKHFTILPNAKYNSILINIIRAINHILPNRFTSDKYIINISGKIKILLLHSESDEIVDVQNIIKLRASGNYQSEYFIIDGTHNNPRITTEGRMVIHNFIN